MNKMSIKQGESTDLFEVTIKDLTDYTNYYGDLYVLKADTDEVVIDAIRINPASNKISVALTPAQTAVLPVGNYTVVVVVVKDVAATIEFKREVSWALKVSKALLT